MIYKGRTVLAFILLAMFASCILTLALVNPSILAEQRHDTGAGAVAAKNDGLTDKDIGKMKTAYNLIEENYVSKMDHDKLVNGAINGMMAALDDPFSTYMDQKEAQQFADTISSSFQGIGAEVSLEDGKVTIMSPIKGSPAEKAGLRANDVIVSVNGEKLDGLSLTQAVMKIRGAKGTEAKLNILRAGSTDSIEVTVVRDDIPMETVFSEMMANDIGKIEITQFSSDTSAHFLQQLAALESKGMKGLIIDVRDDPGGILSEVVKIIQPFVENGKAMVQIEDREGKREPTVAKHQDATKKYPVAVLVNGGSASASEILASAFKEAVPGSAIIGQTTYGKGTVQITFGQELGDGSNIKMTAYKWLTPLGNWIHKKGVEPTQKVEEPSYFSVVPFSRKGTLKPDTVSDDVKSLQIMLQGLGYNPDRTDGYYSEKTAAEVKAFEQAQGLSVAETVDIAVMDKIERAIVGKIKDPQNDLQLKAAVQFVKDSLGQKQ